MRLRTSTFIACAVGAVLTVPAFGAEQPNIVLIVADDLGYPDICAYGCTSGRTPHIDSLAERGVKFTDGYVSAPICSPSRAGMLTGRYQQRFGHEFNAGGQARSHRMGLGTPASETLLPAYLKSAGVRLGQWKLVRLGDLEFLFDLSTDIGEQSNLIEAQPDVAAELRRAYDAWARETRAPLWPPKNIAEVPVELPGIGHRVIDTAI